MRAQIQIYRNPKGVHTLRVCDSADELTAQTLGSLREWVNDHIKEHGEDADFCLTTRDGDSAEYYIERPATEAELTEAEAKKAAAAADEIARKRKLLEQLQAELATT